MTERGGSRMSWSWIIAVALLGRLAAAVEFAGGTGAPNDPYQIATAEQLFSIGLSNKELATKHFVLIHNIDLDPNLSGGKVFNHAPLSLSTGSLDGRGYRILNLNLEATDRIVSGGALFERVGPDAIVRNLVLQRVLIRGSGALVYKNEGSIMNCSAEGTVVADSGSESSGGLVGENSGSISNCSFAGAVINGSGLVGRNFGVIAYSHATAGAVGGGLVGVNRGTILTSYATGDVSVRQDASTDSDPIGGLVGSNFGTISQCYATGAVSSKPCTNYEGRRSSVGGLVGENGGAIEYCYATGVVSSEGLVGALIADNWDSVIGTSGHVLCSYACGAGGSGLVGYSRFEGVVNCYFLCARDGGGLDNGLGFPLTDTQMRRKESFVNWDFAGDVADGMDEIWLTREEGGYPLLAALERPELPGRGTAEDPYLISSRHQLTSLWLDLEAHYRLTGDIDLGGRSFATAVFAQFFGHLDGDGHGINNFTLQGPRGLGFFGTLGPQATVTNLSLRGVHIIITGDTEYAPKAGPCGLTGALASRNRGLVMGCFAATDVIVSAHPTQYIGGLVGLNDGGEIRMCTARFALAMDVVKSVGSADGCGGLVGYNSGRITACHASAHSNGRLISFGGLVGDNGGSIDNCYTDGYISSYGMPSSAGGAGGLVGLNSGSVANCHAAAVVTGSAAGGGLIGHSLNGAVTASYFLRREDGGGPDNGLGTALSSLQMRQPATFTGWDFENMWILCEGSDYPRLQWEGVTCE